MGDKAIRRRVHELRGYFASSRADGPAHIVLNTFRVPLCGTDIDTRAYRRATNMCGNCRRVFTARYVVGSGGKVDKGGGIE